MRMSTLKLNAVTSQIHRILRKPPRAKRKPKRFACPWVCLCLASKPVTVSCCHQTHHTNVLQAKKPFLPLPTLEAVQNKLPWQLVFSQRLGRHAVASQEITAGQCVLAEAAVCALPSQGSCQHTCHSCLKPLPEASDELQLSQDVLLNQMSKHYKRYCSQKCCDADSTVSLTAPVHAKVSQIATKSKCDPTLLHFVLELDAQRQNEAHASFQEAAAPADARQQSGAKLPPGADSAPHDTLDVITCTLADVKALLSPWDRNQKSWREALTAGESLRSQRLGCETHAACMCQVLLWHACSCLCAHALHARLHPAICHQQASRVTDSLAL